MPSARRAPVISVFKQPAEPQTRRTASRSVPFAAPSIDFTLPGQIKEIRIDLSEQSDVAPPSGVVQRDRIGVLPDLTQRTLILIAKLVPRHAGLEVEIHDNGSGAYRKDWVDLVGPLFQSGAPVRFQSPFTQAYSDRELEVFACAAAITVNIDTADRERLAKLRRYADIRQIVTNITMVRAAAIKMLRKPPVFTFTCGLHDANAPGVESLAGLAIATDVTIVEFWDLHDSGHFEASAGAGISGEPLASLPDGELRSRIDAISSAIDLLKARDVTVCLRGDFLNVLASRVGKILKLPDTKMQDEATRDCTLAWTHIELMADGGVRPCPARPDAGSLVRMPLADVLNGGEMRRLRANLINGNLDDACADCQLRPYGTKETLADKVTALRQAVIAPSEFEVKAYLAANPDVAKSDFDPLKHYLLCGRLEGRPLRRKLDL